MYNVFYNLETKEYLGNRFDPEPKAGEGVIQVYSKSDVGLAIKNGHKITVEDDLSITTVPPKTPEPTQLDIAKEAVKNATGQTKRDAMVDYLIMKEGL